MKILKFIFAILLLISVSACKNESKKDIKEPHIALQKKIQNIEFTISGMTCEIGCAKLIESKIHKLEGIQFSKVSFKHKTGQFSFDSNKISIKEIVKNINGIAGGELYKVTQTNIVDEFSKLDTDSKE